MAVQYRCIMNTGVCYKPSRPCCAGCDEKRICDAACTNHPGKCNLSKAIVSPSAQPAEQARFDGAKLSALREGAGYDLETFAKTIEIAKITLWKWEHNKSVPRMPSIKKICSVLGCEKEALMDWRKEDYHEQAATESSSSGSGQALPAQG